MSAICSFSFRLDFLFSWSLGQNNDQVLAQRGRGAITNGGLVGQLDLREASLSPAARNMQRQVRERERDRREQERETDAESLYLLEAAAAANSKKAKQVDKESLEVLIRCTDRLEKSKKKVKTPPQTSFWPRKYIKGLNGTPLSYEPSFSTPSAVYGGEVSITGNEFEDFLTKDVLSRSSGLGINFQPKRSSRSSFSSRLSSVKSSKPELDTSAVGSSDYITKGVDSVMEMIKKVEQQDADIERALAQGISEGVGSPADSPTSSIKHQPSSSGASRKDSMSKENGAGDVGIDTPSHTPESNPGTEDDVRVEPATPESGSDEGEGSGHWEVI